MGPVSKGSMNSEQKSLRSPASLRGRPAWWRLASLSAPHVTFALTLLAAVAHAGPGPGDSGQVAAGPRLVLLPLSEGQGVEPASVRRLERMLETELTDSPSFAFSNAAGRLAQSTASPSTLFEEGKQALSAMRLDEALDRLRLGIDRSAADPAFADVPAVVDAHLSIAIARFRKGDESGARESFFELLRLAPAYAPPAGLPPAFLRELSKAKAEAAKLPRGKLNVDGPVGSAVRVDGREVGRLPVADLELPLGLHFLSVEGVRGERFGRLVEVAGAPTRVVAALDAFRGPRKHFPRAPSVPEVADAPYVDELADYARSVGTQLVLVGTVRVRSRTQWRVMAALFSADRKGFCEPVTAVVDRELTTGQVEAFKLVDLLGRRFKACQELQPLPLSLTPPADAPLAVGGLSDGPRQVPAGPVGGLGVQKGGSQVKSGLPTWAWVAIGAGVALAAGGTYYGVRQANRPVSGTVRVQWE